MYAEELHAKGAPLYKCVVIIYCKTFHMCRPELNGVNQLSSYLGHKRMHCIIYQILTTPDGLIFSLFGLEVGKIPGVKTGGFTYRAKP